MATKNDTRPSVMIIHRNRNVARFLDSALRLKFDVAAYTSPSSAVLRMKEAVPDLILCEPAALLNPEGWGLREIIARFDDLQPPIVFLTGNGIEDGSVAVNLDIRALGCISYSTSPKLLNWLVSNWLSLKRSMDELRATALAQVEVAQRTDGRILSEPRRASEQTPKSQKTSTGATGERQGTPARVEEGGSIPPPGGRRDNSDGLLLASRLLFLLTNSGRTRDSGNAV